MKKKEILEPNEILIAEKFRQIMVALGLDLTDESLKDTPNRVAKMYYREIFAGLRNPTPRMATFPNTGGDQMVLVRKITLQSYCEHHFVPFVGECHIAYMPGKKILGLSKFSRTVQHFAAKPQVQEKLTTEIATHLEKALGTPNIAVVITARHMCCALRGARDINSDTLTSHLGGVFKNAEVRSELFSLIKL